MFNLKRFDLFLIFLFLVLSGTAGWWGYKLNFGNNPTQSQHVGHISSTEYDVFKKGDEEFFYSSAINGSKVFENDQITTGINSLANIMFKGGQTSLALKELSHVIVRSKGKTIAFEIKSGQVEATLAQNESIIIDGAKVIGAKNGNARILYQKGQDGSQLKVLEGEVSFNENNQVRNVKAAPPGAATQNRLIKIEEPLADSYVSSHQGHVKFRWSDERENVQYRIKIFAEKKLINSITLKEKEITMTLPGEGTFTWFVEDLKIPENSSALNKFTLGKKPFFLALQPEPESIITLQEGTTTQEVSFKWQQEVPGDVTLLIKKMNADASSSPEQEIHHKTEAQFGTVNVPLSAGSYQWTLKALQIQSDPNVFSINAAELALLEPPVISDIRLEISDKIRNQGVTSSWPPVEKAIGYEVDFKSTVSRTAQNGARMPQKTVGEANYRARTLNQQNRPGPWSDFKKIVVYQLKVPPVAKAPPAPPLPTPPIPTPTPAPPAAPETTAKVETKMSWNGIEIPVIVSPDSATDIVSRGELTDINIVLDSKSCAEYEVEVDKSTNFSNPTILKLDQRQGQVSLTKGAYHIRARCWKNGDMGTWSIVRKVSIQ